jgi:hypothetical protein
MGLCILWTAISAVLGGHDPVRLEVPKPASWSGRSYDLASDRSVAQLILDAEALVELRGKQQEEWRDRQEVLSDRVPLSEMTNDELRQFHHPPTGDLTGRDERGLKWIRRLGEALLASECRWSRATNANLLREVICALHNGQRPPAPRNLDGIQLPLVMIDHAHNPVAEGRRPAGNLGLDRATAGSDLSLLDPLESTFWSRRQGIVKQDLRAGFGRDQLPDYGRGAWEYAGPKTSYGGNPGYEIRRGSSKAKIKFGETTSEPFTARVFWALGYHADPTDHVRGLKVRYDRRLLREFHLRKEIRTTFRLFWVLPLFTMDLQQRHDPFDYIDRAVLADGRELTVAELKQSLFHDPDRRHPEEDPANYRVDFERQIEHVVTVPANLQLEDATVDSIGPWDFGQLDHADRRELRGACLLAAWLGWYDSRFENTRLKQVEVDGRKELRHYFSDLGGTLGRGKGFFSGMGELVEEFEWTFTRSRFSAKQPGEPVRFSLTGFKPIEDTPAFEEMTVADARWMARLIAQLTEQQLTDALEASGFKPEDVALYVQKLVHRRDRMLSDLGLAGQPRP